MKKFALVLATTIGLTLTSMATAHGVRAQHGGVVTTSGNMQFELVKHNGEAVIYVGGSHGEVVSTTGATGVLTVLKNENRTEVVLIPGVPNSMAIKANTKLPDGVLVSATIVFANKNTVTVPFSAK